MSLPEWTLCLFSCWARIVMLVQHAVPVALSGGMGRGMPVPIMPENVWGDVQVGGAGCPPGPGRLSPALYVREMLSFLPSSCFLPDGNSLPNFLLLRLPLAAQTRPYRDSQRGQTRQVRPWGLHCCSPLAPAARVKGWQGAQDRTSPHGFCLCAQEGFYFLSLCDIISGVSGC